MPGAWPSAALGPLQTLVIGFLIGSLFFQIELDDTNGKCAPSARCYVKSAAPPPIGQQVAGNPSKGLA